MTVLTEYGRERARVRVAELDAIIARKARVAAKRDSVTLRCAVQALIRERDQWVTAIEFSENHLDDVRKHNRQVAKARRALQHEVARLFAAHDYMGLCRLVNNAV